MPDERQSERLRRAVDALVDLHRRVLCGQPEAPAGLYALMCEILIPRLRRRWPGTDPQEIRSAVGIAVCVHLAKPFMFDPLRSRLDWYVTAIAERRIIDGARRDARRRKAEAAWNESRERRALPAVRPASECTLEEVGELVPNEKERRFVMAKIDGERRTAVLARDLGAAGLTAAEQRVLVHRTWMKLRKRLRSRLTTRPSGMGR